MVLGETNKKVLIPPPYPCKGKNQNDQANYGYGAGRCNSSARYGVQFPVISQDKWIYHIKLVLRLQEILDTRKSRWSMTINLRISILIASIAFPEPY
jgi:hypothetical protein